MILAHGACKFYSIFNPIPKNPDQDVPPLRVASQYVLKIEGHHLNETIIRKGQIKSD